MRERTSHITYKLLDYPRGPAAALMALFLLERPTGLPLQCDPIVHDDAVAKQILTYFVRSGRTADTLQGIARWRLLEERLRLSVLQTEAALQWLVEQGFIVELRPAGLRDSVFQLNPKRLKDTRQFLAAAAKKKTQKASGKKRSKVPGS